jgi:ATP-binding cassette subfamily B multidrug efflux pump
MAGPFSRRPAAKPKDVGKTLKRIMKYLLAYRLQLAAVAVSIIVSAAANVAGTYFLKPIINQYIVPYIGSNNPDMTGFASMIGMRLQVSKTGFIAWSGNEVLE